MALENSQFSESFWVFTSLTRNYTDNPAALRLVPCGAAYPALFLGLPIDQGLDFLHIWCPFPYFLAIGTFFDLYELIYWEIIISGVVVVSDGGAVACYEGFGLLLRHVEVLK
jgi:hypothetical protein